MDGMAINGSDQRGAPEGFEAQDVRVGVDRLLQEDDLVDRGDGPAEGGEEVPVGVGVIELAQGILQLPDACGELKWRSAHGLWPLGKEISEELGAVAQFLGLDPHAMTLGGGQRAQRGSALDHPSPTPLEDVGGGLHGWRVRVQSPRGCGAKAVDEQPGVLPLGRVENPGDRVVGLLPTVGQSGQLGV